ncbi:MAG: GH3 auxin-responsive promoter family protein, partial [Candidatus Odinarchaeota archaeon]
MIWSLVSKLLHRVSVKPFIRSLEDPVAAQEKALKTLLNYSAGTTYGKRHGFDDIHGYQDFIDKIPVNQYKDFEPYIQQELKGIPNVFYPEPIEVVMATSGTTGEPKLIPYTRFCNKSVNSMRVRVFTAADQIRPFLHG